MPDSAVDPGLNAAATNADNLEAGLVFLEALVAGRIAEESDQAPPELPKPALIDDGSPLAKLVAERRPNFMEYTVLMLALAPHVRPGLLERAVHGGLAGEADLPQFGGRRDKDSRAVVATGETACFLLAGDDLEARLDVLRLFEASHWLAEDGLVRLEASIPGTPSLSGRLQVSREWVERLTIGHITPPAFSESFPAQRIGTSLTWDDLILEPSTLDHLQDIRRWLLFRDRLEDGAIPKGHLRSGYRALFHGPPGTGKTLAASLLGKLAGLETYRIDLATVTSKYIGETEKNLASLFDTARRRNWVLFFDEADALFGKRTAIKDSHDRYANITVSYLLERVMAYDGLAILATNLRGNIDEAFLGRFETFVRFSMPGEDERRRLWLAAFPVDPAPLDSPVLADALARYELSGRAIVGAVHTATLAALDEGAANLTLGHALRGVQKEIEKEGRVFQALE